MSKSKEVRPPYRTILYNRNGNLATETALDQEKADQFMRISDMRRDIYILDSEEPPQRSEVMVGSDILAFKAIEPISKLTAQVFKSRQYHTLVRDDDAFEVQVLERQIDTDIRVGHFLDRSDYNDQFLVLLNKAVRDGLKEALFREKLGLHDQGTAFLAYGLLMLPAYVQNTEALMGNGQFVEAIAWLRIFLGINLMIQFGSYLYEWSDKAIYGDDIVYDRKRNPSLREDWKEAWLPLVPIDRWMRGRLYLATQGSNLIVPKE